MLEGSLPRRPVVEDTTQGKREDPSPKGPRTICHHHHHHHHHGFHHVNGFREPGGTGERGGPLASLNSPSPSPVLPRVRPGTQMPYGGGKHAHHGQASSIDGLAALLGTVVPGSLPTEGKSHTVRGVRPVREKGLSATSNQGEPRANVLEVGVGGGRVPRGG